ncbi:bifunctional NAD(P)/FAD-dependent oxidoreductase/class I SAM-dependent methyltransferase [Propionicicella superfundia]|uniref:bifunctional NAD(P)/FAD-dependent oxidoreductase/class I SAM-dependent methyltransferase n=1 Tax=Propionicicella superfundia TaxID=348582 RepID=UPI00040FBF22|nr:bifunctional NAD(P)/FAD-dependent oxidoreductase/class I SAM-dependent methyltransferase [Propionicicella superfundia]
MEDLRWDVVVIGGGAAGLSAALMLGRARRRVLVIDAGRPRNRFAAHMHGVLGHEGDNPAELLSRGRAEAAEYGVEFVDGSVERVERDGEDVAIGVTDGRTQRARAVVIASGLSDELPDVPGLAVRWGTSVLHCPYCHGWEFRDRRLGVLVTSPLGLHQAELVRQWSDRVTVFTAGLGDLDPVAERRLRARGVDMVASPLVEIVGDGERIAEVRTADGRGTPLDAMFVVPRALPRDGFSAHAGLARTEGPFGSLLAVDARGRTSDDRIWAVGNVVDPAANVPMAIGAGAATGAAVNAALVEGDVDEAIGRGGAWPDIAPADYWEDRYAARDRVWSGNPNAALVEVATRLIPGRGLDLGCGEGADAIWLAQHGWEVTGIDISPTAVRRAAEAAHALGLPPDRIGFVAADLSEWDDGRLYDLVTSSFLHSPVELARTEALRRAAGRVAPAGHLLIVSHAAAPPWADATDGHEHRFLSPDEEIDALALDPAAWSVVIAETRTREAAGPHGRQGTLDDSVVLLRRR